MIEPSFHGRAPHKISANPFICLYEGTKDLTNQEKILDQDDPEYV